MKHLVRFLLPLVAFAALPSCSKPEEKPDAHGEIITQVRSADRLVFASMAISKTAKMESADWYTIGKRIAVYSYNSYLQAYVDLSKLSNDDFIFDDEAHTVSLQLPPVETEVIGRDMTMRKEYENIGLLRSNLDSKERAEIKEKANAEFRKEVEQNPAFRRRVTDAAERKARQYFEALFESYGYRADISFKK